MKHAVRLFAWPGGSTIYGARCQHCGDSWSVRGNLEFAKIRLTFYREEDCPGPPGTAESPEGHLT